MAALNHPSIVAVFDTGDHAVPGDHDDSVRVPYIVMEFVSGKTIRDLVRAEEVTIDQAIDFSLGVLVRPRLQPQGRHRAPGHQTRQRDVLPRFQQRQGHGLRHRPGHG